MSDLLCLATIVLTALTQASLQLSFGGLTLLYHASLSRHRRKRTRYLAKGYIWGVASISFLMLSSLAFLIRACFGQALNTLSLVVLIGFLLAGAVVMQLCYFRRGKNTELWIPRRISRYITRRIKAADDIIECFSLGTLSNIVEFPLNLILYLVAANALLNIHSAFWQIAAVFAYATISVLPLIALKVSIKSGKNAIEVQQWRSKNKSFLKTIASGSFFTLALFLAGFWINL